MKIVTFGRNSDNNVVINDETVSRHHCQIIQDDLGNFRLTDFSSKNGTSVNDNRITGEVILNRNDTVQIGNTNLLWQNYFIAAKTEFAQTMVQPQLTEVFSPQNTIHQPQPTFAPQQPKPNIASTYNVRERHGFVTFWLWVIIIGGAITAIRHFLQADTIAAQLTYVTGNYVSLPLIYILGVLAVINIGFAVTLLNWKKWGFWALCGSATISMIININIGNAVIAVIGSLLSIVVLWAILQIKKDGISCWKNLE